MNNIIEAEYEIVQERTLPVIVSEIKIIEQHVTKMAIEGAIQIGERLQEAKELAGHGNFGQWCQENLNYSQNTAAKFMRLAEESQNENGMFSNRATWQNISISKAFRLLSVPEEDREKFVEDHDVEDMTVRQLEDEIKKLKEAKKAAEDETEAIREIIHIAEDRSNELYNEVEDLRKQLDEKSAEAVDPEELEKLKTKLEKTEAALAKEKEKLKKEKDDRQAAIDKELKAAGEAMQEQTKKSIDALQAEVDRLKKREQKAGDESLLKFKILVDQLQDVFRQAGECILAEADQEKAEKMNTALKAVLQSMEEDL